ncbi:glycosyltransferase family 2 protein [Sphingobium phenoxybenzoativorans]|uniref:Glycosyltransferase family 2 protein n=1 Tax=Sphingobium phenoxybenzoativorans TaxID=1592790 RepID=A0A975Q1H8_9SPHN|nr:glycosyltransferase family A protein [Sphingobium phenoxybenzoativorans]QUT05681.1 glycosyltransferase family 2 protein [Sphingobium phenoxybenzoativorans]
MNSPRISVITPYRDASLYLGAAIASVEAQSFADWELLLVDDGSIDDSRMIADARAAADPRIRSFSNAPNGRSGAAGARNFALKQAAGEYVAFLDADDIFLPDKLAHQSAKLDAFPDVAMVYGPTHWWYPDDPALDWIENVGPEALYDAPYLLDEIVLLLHGHVPCICAVMMRKSIVCDRGGFEDQFRLYEDQTLWVKVFSSEKILIDAVVTAQYRQHGSSVSAISVREGEYDRMGPHPARSAFLDWAETYLRDHALYRASSRSAMRRARAALSGKYAALKVRDWTAILAYRSRRMRRGLLRRLQGSR